MVGNHECHDTDIKTVKQYRRGQHIFYKGEDAWVLKVNPVFTIRVSGTSHVICGNIFNDVEPSDDETVEY